MAVPTRTVYVGNISYSATSETLMESFAEYEPISVKVIDGKGIAYVEVPARRAFGIVRDLDGSKLEGRMLSVSIATPRENQPTFTQEQDQSRVQRDGQGRENGYRRDDRPHERNPRFSNHDNYGDRNQNGPPNDRNQNPSRGESPRYGDRGRPYGGSDRPQRPGGYSRDGGGGGARPFRGGARPDDRQGPPQGGENSDDRNRSYGDRPAYPRRDGDRPSRPYQNGGGDRPPPRYGAERPNRENGRPGDRPAGDQRPGGPSPDRTNADRPYRPNSGNGRSSAPGAKPKKFFKKR